MRKTAMATAVIISIGMLAGASGSASSRLFEGGGRIGSDVGFVSSGDACRVAQDTCRREMGSRQVGKASRRFLDFEISPNGVMPSAGSRGQLVRPTLARSEIP
jgi:hypothetical protein